MAKRRRRKKKKNRPVWKLTSRQRKRLLKTAFVIALILFGVHYLYDWAHRNSISFEKPRLTKPRATAPSRISAQPKLVFVIDDIGHTREDEKTLKRLGRQVTYSILPNLRHTNYFSQLSRETGAEVILHLPLESSSNTIPGPGLITQQMTSERIREQLERDLNSVSYRVGANNHMGSAGTENTKVMEVILTNLKSRGLFFLDSYTTPNTVGPTIAKRLGMPVLIRDVFLDNVDEKTAIENKIEEMKQIARRKGYAIGIGHYRKNTLEILEKEIAISKKQGFEIISLSKLIQIKRTA